VSTTDTSKDTSTNQPETYEMKLEVIGLPVSDVNVAFEFYATKLGWRLDADFAGPDGGRALVQVTPPGSACSVHFGRGVTEAAPGSADHLYLVVADIEAARAALVRRGVDVSDVFNSLPGQDPKPGRDPDGNSYTSFVTFSDPDGNSWTIQEITTRLPGR
jgi:catechol 2,3-dioxygenase-like lactoylglutathione lyase family enzyme